MWSRQSPIARRRREVFVHGQSAPRRSRKYVPSQRRVSRKRAIAATFSSFGAKQAWLLPALFADRMKNYMTLREIVTISS